MKDGGTHMIGIGSPKDMTAENVDVSLMRLHTALVGVAGQEENPR